MPLNLSRRLTGRERTAQANTQLGYALAFIAGATNAGGFLAVHQYTSHMTGIVSAMADHLVLGSLDAVFTGLEGLLCFVAGAMACAMLVNFARRRRLFSEYALPLLLESILLLGFGLAGAQLQQFHGGFVPTTVMLLCFIMGLQNALISKISRSEIRTTHVTGTLTDIGIELGKLAYWNHPQSQNKKVMADRRRLGALSFLLASFFVGGIAGAVGFKQVGYACTVPLALILIALAIAPALDDVGTGLSGRRDV